MSQRRSIIKHPHDYAGAPQILSPVEGFGERFDPSFLSIVGSSSGNGNETTPASSSNNSGYHSSMIGSGDTSASHLNTVSSPASSGIRSNDYNLVPQRSAPLPPGAAAATPPGVYARSGGSSLNNSYAKGESVPSFGAQQPSLYRPNMHDTASSSSVPSLNGGSISRSGLPGNSSGLPSGYSPHSASTGPPRPIRSQTLDTNHRSAGGGGVGGGANVVSGASGFMPASARSQVSIGGPAPAPHLSPPVPQHSSPRAAAWDTAGMGHALEDSVTYSADGGLYSAPGTPNQYARNNAARQGANMGPDGGRNTFKSVFGGFVNSMSGK